MCRNLVLSLLVLLLSSLAPASDPEPLLSIAQGNGGSRDGGFYTGLLSYLGVSIVHELDPGVDYSAISYRESCQNHFRDAAAPQNLSQGADALQREFFAQAMTGLQNLEALAAQSEGALSGESIRSTQLTQESIVSARTLLQSEQIQFSLDRSLVDDKTGLRLTATNSIANQSITLNPQSWEAIRLLFQPRIANELMQAIATHEVLSLIGVERSNFYPFSVLLASSTKAGVRSGENLLNGELHTALIAESFVTMGKFLAERSGSEEGLEVYFPEESTLAILGDMEGYYRRCNIHVIDWDIYQQASLNACGESGFHPFCQRHLLAASGLGVIEEKKRSQEIVSDNQHLQELAPDLYRSLVGEQLDRIAFLEKYQSLTSVLKRTKYQTLGFYAMDRCELTHLAVAESTAEAVIQCTRDSLVEVEFELNLVREGDHWQRTLEWFNRPNDPSSL